MQEIEVKFKVDSLEQIAKQLKDMDAELEWSGLEENIYFDTPEGTFTDNDKTLRIKKCGDHGIVLTFKGEQEGDDKFKVRKEVQVMVDDLENVKELLKSLGYVEVLKYEKEREHWILGDVCIELDKIKNGNFVELEGSREDIENLADKLNLNWDKSNTKSYIDLLGLEKSV